MINKNKDGVYSDADDSDKPILPKDQLAHHKMNSDNSSSKKKKIIGGVVIGVAVLALVLGLTLRKKSSDDPQPGPGPTPFVPINPYYLDGDLNTQTQVFTGVLQLRDSAVKQLQQNLRGVGDTNVIKVLDPRIIPTGDNNPVLDKISFEIGQADFKTSYLWLSDPKNSRYSIPPSVTPKPKYQQIFRTDMCGLSIETNPFTFTFTDSAHENKVLVTSKNSHFLLTDKYLQLDLQLPSQKIFGLGERNHEFGVGEGTWTMWAHHNVDDYDDGRGGKSGKGVHPFALVESGKKGVYFGIFFRNSNAQSPIINFNDDGSSVLSYITTGGNIEIYFFWKGSAKQIIQQYQNFIGKPTLPPFWALGWHAGSKSYKKLDDVKAMVDGYKAASMPLESVWLNPDVSKSGANFEVNTDTYPDLASYRATLDATNQKIVLTKYAGIDGTVLSDHYMIEGQADQVFINSSIHTGGDYQGALVTAATSNQTLFLDFLHPNATKLWAEGIKSLHTATKFDGISIIGNEPFADCNGECPDGIPPVPPTQKEQRALSEAFLQVLLEDGNNWYQSYSDQKNISTYNLPFIPFATTNLDNMTLSLNATHVDGSTEYNLHNLMGHLQAAATKTALDSDVTKTQRQFILSSGTFSGSGQYAGHSTQPNLRSWDTLKNSTAQIMNMNMFGIPFTGPDVCGTYGDIDEELCARWIQTSAFYPLARQYPEELGLEPFNMKEQKNKDMASASLKERLRYSRQLYTCMFEAKDSGNTCFDPVFFYFPTDDKAVEHTEKNFVFANSILVTPVNQPNVETVKSYLPAGQWVSMKDYKVTTSGGEEVEIAVQPDVAIQHLMPGKIVTKQMGDFMTTADLKNNVFTLVANRDTNGHAEGTLYIDDGITKDQPYDYMTFQLSANSFKKWVSGTSGNTKKMDKLVITNAADLQQVDFACVRATDDYAMTALEIGKDATQGAETLTLSLKDSTIDLGAIKDIHWGNSAKDLNLCDISSQYYKLADGQTLDLTKPTASATLTSLTPKDSLPDLTLSLTVLQTGVVNVYWSVADKTKFAPFEVPVSIIDPQRGQVGTDPLSKFVTVSTAASGAINLSIINAKGNAVFTLNGMILSKYLNFMDTKAMTKLGSKGIMGLFERVSSDLYLPDGVYSLWSLDTANPVETGKPPGNNLYGTHPFYMAMDQDDSWFGVFTNLAAGQDWWIKSADATTKNVGINTYATGGVGDLFFMMGANPNEVTKQYHKVVGTPVLIPQWALGWNQCRWGYNNTDALRAVVAGYESKKIPLDTQWSDIDWMKNYQDFVYDDVSFKGLPDFINELHTKNMHYIPIIDAGLAKRTQGYEPYADGVGKDVFIKVAGADGKQEVFTGQVWPNDAAFPDFFNPETPKWWQSWMSKFHDTIAFDGLWLDMNEASNFCTGVCYQSQRNQDPLKYKLPYVPTGRDLEQKSITLDGIHAGGVTELDAHSLFGTMEVKATHEWFASQKKRTVIIERSSYAGMGKFGSRWLGDNFSNEQYMGYSVTGIMGHNIMGIPLAGSDICGFIGNTNPELCARWHMVGAFYPFSRNHNSWDTDAQEPYQPVFEKTYAGTVSYTQIMQRAIYQKYDMIRYYYSELSFLSQEGGAFYKPLFFEFPGEAGAYLDQENNIMLGSALKLGILANKLGQNSTQFYYPEGVWCNVYGMDCITSPAGGQKVSQPSYAFNFNLYLRAGHMFPKQNATALNVKTSHDLKAAPIELHILASCDAQTCTATGRYLNDDGESLDVTGKQNIYSFGYSQAVGQQIKLTVKAQENAKKVDANDVLGQLQIYNAVAQGLNKDFTVQATKLDKSTVDLNKALFSANDNKLIWKAIDGEAEVDLTQIDFITLTASA